MTDKYSLIKFWEGLPGSHAPALVAYKDGGGVWTIGWGHTKNVKEGDTCTIEQAQEWIEQDASEADKAILVNVKVPINENQHAALLSFVFNVGTWAFVHSTLLRLLNEKHYESAGDQLMNWVHDNGKRVQGLVNRRQAEKDLWELPV